MADNFEERVLRIKLYMVTANLRILFTLAIHDAQGLLSCRRPYSCDACLIGSIMYTDAVFAGCNS